MALKINCAFAGTTVNKVGVLNIKFEVAYESLPEALSLTQWLGQNIAISFKGETVGERFKLNKLSVDYEGTALLLFNALVNDVDQDVLNSLYAQEGEFTFNADESE